LNKPRTRTRKQPSVRVSVVVPTLNEEANVAGCIDSLKRQSLKPLEIIIADGGSTDATRSIAKKRGAVVVVEKTRTIAAGRQRGSRAAKGEIIAYTDADAVLPENWLEELAKPFCDARVSCVFGSLRLSDATLLERLLSRVLAIAFAASAFVGSPSGAGSCMAVRASAFRKSGGFDTRLVTAEDVDLQKKLKKFGRVVYAPAAVASVSPRRVRKWGYPKFILFHLRNWFKASFLGTPECNYEPVR